MIKEWIRKLGYEKKEEDAIILFHGGCHGCTIQMRNGIDFCRNCRYFDCNWKLPCYNDKPLNAADIARRRIKEKYKVQLSRR
ncbi:MAG: hypothetical protein HOG49_39235 [Candidatus Scalindua sp.]|jgi:hypothetical protein|nr:hypothetical protein [Candidatus Scalindua sp.]